jgi:hypothetical protein
MLTAELIREILNYDPETGRFTWRKARSNRVRVGSEAGCDAGDEIGRVIRLENYNHRVSRLAWLYMTGEWPEHHVYAINGDIRDTRWKNLEQRTRGSHLAPHSYRKASGDPLTQERLRQLLAYDKETGVFTHIAPVGARVKAGDLAGFVNDRGYVKICVDGRSYRGHHLAWLYVHGQWPSGKLDHKDRNRSNNRIDNLREATNSQNQANRAKQRNNTSGYKGVYWIEGQQKWLAKLVHKRKQYHLGLFATPEAAHEAYRAGAKRIHGEFARTE